MHSYDKKRFHSFQADASALGGLLRTPVSRLIPTAAPAALPAAGGFASARHEAFNLDGIISYSSARSWVTGYESQEDRSIATVATAVVEDLNFLDVVTAKRVTAQVSVAIGEHGERLISLGGSGFEGLRIAGLDEPLKANGALRRPSLELGQILEAAREQSTRLIHGSKDLNDSDAHAWTVNRFGNAGEPGANGHVLCSLVDDIEGAGENRCGHFIVLPGFGRFFFGELLVSRHSVQYVSIRAELGCAVGGSLAGPTAQVSGGTTGGPDR
jgi:hypothetical protein